MACDINGIAGLSFLGGGVVCTGFGVLLKQLPVIAWTTIARGFFLSLRCRDSLIGAPVDAKISPGSRYPSLLPVALNREAVLENRPGFRIHRRLGRKLHLCQIRPLGLRYSEECAALT
jgi:hypothetical protein